MTMENDKNNHITAMSSIRYTYFEKPIVNRMTQGSIINGCVADAFPGEEVFGLIITPRCDVSHEGKVDSVHYLPVVPFERWFEVVAKPKIKEIWKKSIYGQLNDQFKSTKIGDDVMGAGFTYDDLLKICDEKVKKKASKEKIKSLLNSYFLTQEINNFNIRNNIVINDLDKVWKNRENELIKSFCFGLDSALPEEYFMVDQPSIIIPGGKNHVQHSDLR